MKNEEKKAKKEKSKHLLCLTFHLFSQPAIFWPVTKTHSLSSRRRRRIEQIAEEWQKRNLIISRSIEKAMTIQVLQILQKGRKPRTKKQSKCKISWLWIMIMIGKKICRNVKRRKVRFFLLLSCFLLLFILFVVSRVSARDSEAASCPRWRAPAESKAGQCFGCWWCIGWRVFRDSASTNEFSTCWSSEECFFVFIIAHWFQWYSYFCDFTTNWWAGRFGAGSQKADGNWRRRRADSPVIAPASSSSSSSSSSVLEVDPPDLSPRRKRRRIDDHDDNVSSHASSLLPPSIAVAPDLSLRHRRRIADSDDEEDSSLIYSASASASSSSLAVSSSALLSSSSSTLPPSQEDDPRKIIFRHRHRLRRLDTEQQVSMKESQEEMSKEKETDQRNEKEQGHRNRSTSRSHSSSATGHSSHNHSSHHHSSHHHHSSRDNSSPHQKAHHNRSRSSRSDTDLSSVSSIPSHISAPSVSRSHRIDSPDLSGSSRSSFSRTRLDSPDAGSVKQSERDASSRRRLDSPDASRPDSPRPDSPHPPSRRDLDSKSASKEDPPEDLSGTGAATILRDASGRRVQTAAQALGILPMKEERKMEWGSGLAQAKALEDLKATIEQEKDKVCYRVSRPLLNAFASCFCCLSSVSHLLDLKMILRSMPCFASDSILVIHLLTCEGRRQPANDARRWRSNLMM